MNASLDELSAALEQAKAAEMDATATRIESENKLIALLGVKSEGSATHKGAAYKVTVTGVVHRKVDEAALAAVRATLPPAIFEQVFRFKPDLITAGMRYLQSNEPELYAVAAQAITATPGKPSVRVEHLAANEAAA